MKKIIFSAGLLISGVLVSFALAPSAKAAVVFSESAYQNVSVGQTFVAEWFLDTEQENLNAVDLQIDFSKDTLEAAEVNTGNSSLVIIVQKPYISNTKGKIQVIGGIPNGIISSKAPLFRITFKAIKTGAAFIKLNPQTQILQNTESANPALLKSTPIVFAVTAENSVANSAIRSSTHPDQQQWYQDNNVTIQLQLEPGKKYSYSFSSNVDIIPENKTMPVKEVLNYDNLPDGIYYFKLNALLGNNTAVEEAVYRIQIDKTPPQILDVQVTAGKGLGSNQNFLVFEAVDKQSGIANYQFKAGLSRYQSIDSSLLLLKKPWIGSSLALKVTDRAGNYVVKKVPYNGYVAVNVALFLLILLLIGAVIWFNKKIRNQN